MFFPVVFVGFNESFYESHFLFFFSVVDSLLLSFMVVVVFLLLLVFYFFILLPELKTHQETIRSLRGAYLSPPVTEAKAEKKRKLAQR